MIQYSEVIFFVLFLPASKRKGLNDDNEEPAAKKQSKAKGKKKMVSDDFENIKIRRPKLVVKVGIKNLVDAIEKMNKRQLAALEEMGFGQLVHLKIRSIPAEMAFSLLENFNLDNCTRIKLIDDEPLHITEEDVHATLGLPRGERKINIEKKYYINDDMQNIAKAVKKDRNSIYATDLQDQLDTDVDGGELFKKVFLVLLDSVLISPSANGICDGRILDYIDNISNVRKYNWCNYVLNVLITAHDSWKKKNKSTPFTGPITFLLVSFLI